MTESLVRGDDRRTLHRHRIVGGAGRQSDELPQEGGGGASTSEDQALASGKRTSAELPVRSIPAHILLIVDHRADRVVHQLLARRDADLGPADHDGDRIGSAVRGGEDADMPSDAATNGCDAPSPSVWCPLSASTRRTSLSFNCYSAANVAGRIAKAWRPQPSTS